MRCEYCDRDIAHGEEYYDIDGHTVCIDDVLDWLEENCVGEDFEGSKVYIFDDMEIYPDELNKMLLSNIKVCDEPIEEDEPPWDEPDYWEDR